jgi:hypothetical protein
MKYGMYVSIDRLVGWALMAELLDVVYRFLADT